MSSAARIASNYYVTIAVIGIADVVGPCVSASLYAEGIAICYAFRYAVAFGRRLQIARNRLLVWALDKRLSSSSAKTQCSTFALCFIFLVLLDLT